MVKPIGLKIKKLGLGVGPQNNCSGLLAGLKWPVPTGFVSTVGL